MVDAVTGRAALASLTGLSSANQTSTRKNPLLPTPLSSSQQGSAQRASPILRFDVPRISSGVFSTLQNSALLSVARQEVVGVEREALELELRRRVVETETPGSPGSPGTPDQVTTTTVTQTSLSADALDALAVLIRSFGGGYGHGHGHHGHDHGRGRDDRNGYGYGRGDDYGRDRDYGRRYDSGRGRDDDRGYRYGRDHGGGYGGGYDRTVLAGLQDNLARFSDRLGSGGAGRDLGEVIGRLENSVIGKGGLDFFDLFRDPALFGTLIEGLGNFERQTGSSRATQALGNLILAVGDPAFGNGSANSRGTRRVGEAIDQLADSLAGNGNAARAVDDFLDLLQDRRVGGGQSGGQGGNPGDYGRYARRIAGILGDALTDLQNGSLDAAAVQRLQDAIGEIGDLPNLPGRRDNRLRERAVDGLQDILDRYTTVTQTTQTTVTPGQPATPPTPPGREVSVLEETTLVPRLEIVQRVVTVYQSVQDQLKPLQKLSEPPPATPSLTYLVQPPGEQDDEERGNRFVIRADGEASRTRIGPAEDDGAAATRPSDPVGGSLYGGFGSAGQLYDARA